MNRIIVFLFVALIIISSCRENIDKKVDKKSCAEAFAEAYGLVRWFYPGDMPEGFDWNKFALYGIREVLKCENEKELKMTLDGLFGPVAPGVEFSDSDEYGRWELVTPEDTSGMYQIAWQHCGVDLGPESNWYVSKRTGRAMQTDNSSKTAVELALVPGLPYDRIKVSADIRNHNPESLRIYFKTAFNTGMNYYTSVCRDGKPENAVAQDSAWHSCVRRFGAASAGAVESAGSGSGTVDAGGRIVVFVDGKGSFSIKNVTLHLPDGNKFKYRPEDLKAWSKYNGVYDYSVDGGTVTVSTRDRLFEDRSSFGDMAVRKLADGLYIHVPLALYGTDESTFPAYDDVAARELIRKAERAGELRDDVTMCADIAVAWNAMKYFHPYLSDLDLDWDAALSEYMGKTVERTVYDPGLLRRMLALLDDAHIAVTCPSELADTEYLPLRVRRIGDEIVVVHSEDNRLKAGDVIVSVNGRPAISSWRECENEISGSPQYKSVRAETLWLRSFGHGKDALLSVEDGNGTREVEVTLIDRTEFITGAGSALFGRESGWINDSTLYINTSRSDMDCIRTLLRDRTAGQKVIVDNRYGSRTVAMHLLAELISGNVRPPREDIVKIPQVYIPETPVIQNAAENVSVPVPDRNLIFLANASNISHFEDAYDYMRYIGAGIIIGSPTGGCTGRINTVRLPSGTFFTFTGTKVFSHLGRQGTFYAKGIKPDVHVEETVEDIRNGNDKILKCACPENRPAARSHYGIRKTTVVRKCPGLQNEANIF